MTATALSYALTKWEEGIEKGVFTATMEWTLQVTISSDVADMAPSKVAGLFEWLPVEGVNYSAYNSLWPRATCRGVSSSQIEGGVYSYSTKWSDEASKNDQQATNEDPTEDLPIIKPVGGTREKAITRDRDDKPILNKAGDPVAQSIEENTIGLTITAKVAVDSGVELLVLSLRDRVNDAPIQVGNWYIDTNMARVVFGSNFLSEVKRRNGIEYFEFTFELLIDERDKHQGRPLNAGFREKWVKTLSPFAEELRTILAPDGSEPSEAAPLDEDGLAIALPTPDNVIYLEIDKYQEGDFTQLPGVIAWAGP